MNELARFEFEGKAVRVVGTHDNPLFHANDLCATLEFSNPHDAIARHVEKDDLVKREVIDSMGRKQAANYVTEPGMWALVMRAGTDAAKRVQRWVTHEVLPALRKTGRYETKEPEPAKSQRALLGILREQRLAEAERRRSADALVRLAEKRKRTTPKLPTSTVDDALARAMEMIAGGGEKARARVHSGFWANDDQIATDTRLNQPLVGCIAAVMGLREVLDGLTRETEGVWEYSGAALEALMRACRDYKAGRFSDLTEVAIATAKFSPD